MWDGPSRERIVEAAGGSSEGAAFAAHYVLSLAAAARNVWQHAPARAVVLRTVHPASRAAAADPAADPAGGTAGGAEAVPAEPATGEPPPTASHAPAEVEAVAAVAGGAETAPALPAASLRVREEVAGTPVKP